MEAAEEKETLNEKEAAAFLGRSVQHLRALRRVGAGPSWRDMRRPGAKHAAPVYHVDALREYARGNKEGGA